MLFPTKPADNVTFISVARSTYCFSEAVELAEKNGRLLSSFASRGKALITSRLWVGRFSGRSKHIIMKQ
jgi:hypothetical protein